MSTALELREQRAQIWEQMKEIRDRAEAGPLSAEDEQAWTKAETDIESLDTRIQVLEIEMRAPETDPEKRLHGPAPETATVDGPQRVNVRAMPEYSRAFRNWMQAEDLFDLDPADREILKAGRHNLSPAEYRNAQRQLRQMGTTSMTAGGFLVPENQTFRDRLEKALLFFGGMRQVGTIIPTDDGADLSLPTSDDTGNTGRRLAENVVLTETNPTVGLRTWRAYMYTSDLVRVPYQLLQDSAFDIETWLADILGERIGRAQNTDFTTGTGVDQPQGIAPASVQGRAGAAGQTTTVIWEDLIFLEHAVGIAYRQMGARYMMHDNTVRDLRRLTDGEGRFLWQPGVQVGAPNTINGYPYTVNNDVAAMAASARSILFGLLSKYIIREVRGVLMVRLNERYADNLQVGFFSFARADGGLLDAGTNPVQHYANPAT